MRELLKFDSFDIMQKRVIKKGLKLNHLFLLDYLISAIAGLWSAATIAGISAEINSTSGLAKI